MNTCDDAAVKRSLLLGARIRFSPSGASVRSQAIERIIEQNLASAEAAKGLTEQQLQNLVALSGHFATLRTSDIKQGIDSLEKLRKLSVTLDGRTKRYQLSDDTRSVIARIITDSEERTNIVIKDLFGSATGGEKVYSRAFLRVLCTVFSKLSEVYVQVITSRQPNKEFTEHRLLLAAIEDTLRTERNLDKEAFRYGVNRFFRESTPQFDQIKWNMAQNFYVAKALGIDTATDILSSELFREATLYCDTNVLIAGLTPGNRHHNSFLELTKACQALGVNLKVSYATAEELKSVILGHAALLKKVYEKIPDEMQKEVKNFILEGYLAERQKTPDLQLDDFIREFMETIETLRDSFGIVREDDRWFDEGQDDVEVKKIAQELSKIYEEIRKRPKGKNASIHDAILLMWVARENADNRASWIVTLDSTLAKWNAQTRKTKVITLDAFLQWMSPVTSDTANEGQLAEIFSAAIRYQLLPRDTFFRLSDFQVFADMGIETKLLPAEDVEACIRDIRQAVANADPSKAEDREKIGHIIQKYFADPGTKYKRTTEALQTQSESIKNELIKEKRLRDDAEKRVGELETGVFQRV
ncbi:MAG: hypothetical protein JW893_02685 [Candidatus Omnitrophica bacterium]|nr:hypothetical protein [Candidatus Omnitrophota bacterium]